MTDERQQEQVRQSMERLSLSRRTEYPDHDAIEDMMERAAERASIKAVRNTLELLGIDASNPISAQQDFAKLRILRKLLEDEQFQLDLAFIRRWRVNSDKVVDTSVSTVVRWVVVGILGIIALVTKDWWITHIKG